MATRIIKEGQKKFVTKCPICGCEFEYELDDIYGGGTNVNCPCCGCICQHQKVGEGNIEGITHPYPNMIPCDKKNYDPMTVPDIVNPDKPDITWANQKLGNSCENCHIYRKMLKGEYVVDDSCYWCSNNPNKVTCVSNNNINNIK